MNLYFKLLWLYWHIRWWCLNLVRISFRIWDLCFDSWWWWSVSWFLTKVSLSIIFILSLFIPLVRWHWSATDQQEKQIKSLEGTWEGKTGTPKKELVGERQEGLVLFQSGCGSRGLCRGIPFFFPRLLFPQRSWYPSSPLPKETRPSILPGRIHICPLNTFLTAVWESTALIPLILQSWRDKKLGKSFLLLQKWRDREPRRKPQKTISLYFFSYFKAHSSWVA